ncbi:MAG: DUF4297 domain-containing protein [Desulfobulbaceae bacterium]|nr:DUF4297 domain-containing protein [Desulfobulbaceae bacterium]
MGSCNTQEIFRIASDKQLAETGGGHNQKGVDFQRVWALTRMFELEESGADDFLILFEAIQDVAELDSEFAPSSIRIYQIKKKDRGEWEWSHLTCLPAPGKKARKGNANHEIKASPIGKLYSSVLAFKDLKSSGAFLSNVGCNLLLANGDSAATSVSCDLSQLESGHLDLLKAGLESLHVAGDSLVNPGMIRVGKIPIHPDAPATHLQGVVVAFLSKRSPRHAGQAKSLVDALLASVGPLGGKTDSCSNFEDLRRQRGYSRKQFASALGSLEQIPDHLALAETWLDQLVSEGVLNFMEATSIRVAMAAIFKRQVMGGEDPLVSALAYDCDAWLETNTPGPLLGDFFGKAKSYLAPLHPSFRAAELTAHIALRAVRKCVDQI